MVVANRAIKARGKASPDRLQDDLRNSKMIRAGAVLGNSFVHVAEHDELVLDQLPEGDISLPLDFWLANKSDLASRGGACAVQLAADQTVGDIAQHLEQVDIVVLPIVNFVDGRCYSHAQLLRKRYQYKGEIRAVGDVYFDQLDFLERCGCDAFELPDDENLQLALTAFDEFSEVYQPAADGETLIFSRRRMRH